MVPTDENASPEANGEGLVWQVDALPPATASGTPETDRFPPLVVSGVEKAVVHPVATGAVTVRLVITSAIPLSAALVRVRVKKLAFPEPLEVTPVTSVSWVPFME